MELVNTVTAPYEETDRPQKFHVFTHSRRARAISMLVFLSYCVLFVLFSGFLLQGVQEVNDVSGLMSRATQTIPNWMFYILVLLTWALSLSALGYFAWQVVDIWGLQVHLSRNKLVVHNTITGRGLKRLMGVGELEMDHIVAIRGAGTATYISGHHQTLRISPVQGIETLVQSVLRDAPHVEVID